MIGCDLLNHIDDIVTLLRLFFQGILGPVGFKGNVCRPRQDEMEEEESSGKSFFYNPAIISYNPYAHDIIGLPAL